jgi:hypothetical protein
VLPATPADGDVVRRIDEALETGADAWEGSLFPLCRYGVPM